MTAVQPGQTYQSNKPGGPVVRVVRIANTEFNGHGYPAAWVEDATTGKRARWIALDKLHTDGKQRRTGYNLKEEA